MRQSTVINGVTELQAGAMRQPSSQNISEDELLTSRAACSLTKRVMAVSQFPERMHSLLRILSAECFDLFTLHDLNRAFVSSLQPELVIYDATPHPQFNPDAVDALRAALLQTAHLKGVALLLLVGEQAAMATIPLPEGVELLVWPAEPEEALHRVNRLLPSQSPLGAGVQSGYYYKDLTINLKKMTVYRGEERIDLTKTEYELLLMFVTSDGAVLTREAMFDSVWGSHYLGGSNVVDVHIKTLRKKLKDSAVSPKYIVTVRGAGYRLADERRK